MSADLGAVEGLRMPAARKMLGSKSNVLLMSGRDVSRVVFHHNFMLPATNVRLRHGLAGIMKAAEEKQSALEVEAAFSEVQKNAADKSKLKEGYSGMTPSVFGQFVLETAEKVGFTQPLILHVDHTTIKKDDPAAIDAAREQLSLYLNDGIAGQYSIDASFLPIWRNIEVTSELAKPILEAGFGLEVEVGEIGLAMSKAKIKTGEVEDNLLAKKGQITTVWEVRGIMDPSERVEFINRYDREPTESETRGFIPALIDCGTHPDLLAIDNGSKHGNYKPGEDVSIFLGRTCEVADAISRHKIAIAQHGITGTPEKMLYLFILAGIRKGNIGTEWQNQAHKHMDQSLLADMKAWAEAGGYDLKLATKQFYDQIEVMDLKYVDAINQATYERMLTYLDAFKCAGSGPKIIQALNK